MAFLHRRWDDAAFLVRYSTATGRGPHNLERLAKQQLLLTLQGGAVDPVALWHFAFPGEFAPDEELIRVSQQNPLTIKQAAYILKNLLQNQLKPMPMNGNLVNGPKLSLLSPFKANIHGHPMPVLLELASELKQRFGVGWNHAITYYFLALSSFISNPTAGAELLKEWSDHPSSPEVDALAKETVDFLLLTRANVLEPNKEQVQSEWSTLAAYMHVQLPEHYKLPPHPGPSVQTLMTPAPAEPTRVIHFFGKPAEQPTPAPAPVPVPAPAPVPLRSNPQAPEAAPTPPKRKESQSPPPAPPPQETAPVEVVSTEPDAKKVPEETDEEDAKEGDGDAEPEVPESAKVDAGIDSVQAIAACCKGRPSVTAQDCYDHDFITEFAQDFNISLRRHTRDNVYRCALIRHFSKPGDSCRAMMRQHLPTDCADTCAHAKAPCGMDRCESAKKWCRFLAPYDACDSHPYVSIEEVERFNRLVNDSCPSGERVLSLAQQIKRFLLCHVGPCWRKGWQRLWGRPPCAQTCTVVDAYLKENKYCIPPRTMQRIAYLAPRC